MRVDADLNSIPKAPQETTKVYKPSGKKTLRLINVYTKSK